MSRLTKKWQNPGVVFHPRVHEGMRTGINTIVEAIRPTLGPFYRIVLIEKESKVGRPELYDDGAVIARRIIQLANRDEDMGAMYLRQLLWKMHETVGDGTATAAVMFQTIYNEGLRYIAAGGNAMRLRFHLEAASKIILEELDSMVIHLQGKELLAKLAKTICYDPELAKILGEIMDTIGEYGHLEIRSGRSRKLEREYFEGAYWDGGVLSRDLLLDSNEKRTKFDNAAILISDMEIKEPRELLPVLDTAIKAGHKALLVIAASISDRALSLLLSKTNRARIEVVVVRSPALDAITRKEALEDLALLAGGRAFFQAAGETLRSVCAADLGQARRMWANESYFGIVGGKGDPRILRQHIARLRAGYRDANDPEVRTRLHKRLGKLIGGSATLWVGDTTPFAIEMRKALAERTAEAMRGAIADGVLPGGGIALLACQKALHNKLKTAEDPDEHAACNILLKALETPIRTLLNNAGYEPGKILHRMTLAGPGFGFHLMQAKVVEMDKEGIFDAATVVKAAVLGAIHGAALALTVDVLVHRKNPPEALNT
jgi:chaperonin GroEL